MTLKRSFSSLILAAALPFALVGCGDDADGDGGGGGGGDGGGDGGNDVLPPVGNCGDDVGQDDVDPQYWRLTGLTLPSAESTEVLGYNLDSHNTRLESDPIGCGKVDEAGGIDNALGGLLSQVGGLLEGFLDGKTLDEVIAGALNGPDGVSIVVKVDGYEGAGDSNNARATLLLDGEPLEGVTDVCANVDAAGNLSLRFAELPIPLDGISDEVPPGSALTISNLIIGVDAPNGNSAEAMLGGGVNGAAVEQLVGAIAPDYASLIADLIGEFADLGPNGACDAVSLGAKVELTQVDAPDAE